VTRADTYRGWSISYDPPPIPIRDFDWRATHPDYDASCEDGEWTDNGMKVEARTRDALLAEIDAWIAEDTGIPFFCKPCGEMLTEEQTQCPFCMNPATPLDEVRA
jgi:hypothetical protein